MRSSNFPVVVVLMTAFLLTGCLSDVVTEEYRTLDEAKNANAFGRGWLPPILPEGSTDIVDTHNLDTNVGHGTFRFPPNSLQSYLDELKSEFNAEVNVDDEQFSVKLIDEETEWKIELDQVDGQGKYEMKYLR